MAAGKKAEEDHHRRGRISCHSLDDVLDRCYEGDPTQNLGSVRYPGDIKGT